MLAEVEDMTQWDDEPEEESAGDGAVASLRAELNGAVGREKAHFNHVLTPKHTDCCEN
jgi:hypothetical protein